MTSGWKCPHCGRAHAPDVKTCPEPAYVAPPNGLPDRSTIGTPRNGVFDTAGTGGRTAPDYGRPAGYVRLADHVTCKCADVYVDDRGVAYCCNKPRG